MPANLQALTQMDFSGGANYVVNPYLIPPNQLADARNVVFDEHGSIRVRDGLKRVATSPLTDQPILFRGYLVRDSGTEDPFIIQRVASGVNRLYRQNSDGSFTAIQFAGGADFSLGEDLPDAVTVGNTAVILNGYETPARFDGTTLTRITAGTGETVPPGGRHGAFHLGSLWLWNTAAADTTLDGPSSLRMSGPNDPNSWPNANQTFVGKGDGQVGMGMTSFTIVETGISPTATLVLFKNYSAYQVTGTFGSSNFGVQRIKTDMGCIAPRTIQFVSGFGVIRLTHKGFALYNGVEDRLISEPVRPAIFGGGEFTPLDFSTIHLSWAAQAQNPPLYLAACPESGTSLTRIFVYDLIRRGWSIVAFPGPGIRCLTTVFPVSRFPHVELGTTTGGEIHEWFTGEVTDNGTEISWEVETRAFSGRSPLTPAYFRRAMVLGSAGRTPITVQPIVDEVSRDPLIYTPQADETSSARELRWEIPLMVKARQVRLRISGSGPARVRGVEVHVGPQPLSPSTLAQRRGRTPGA